jgi:hypothetical protein
MNSRSEDARDRVRTNHHVRLVDALEEGTAAQELPPGVYGFTGSPGLAAPLFAQRRYRNFEIHHLADGGIAIVGFVTPQSAERLAGASDAAVVVYPDIEGEATEIVTIRYAQIAHHRQYSILNAPGMSLRVTPLPTAALT